MAACYIPRVYYMRPMWEAPWVYAQTSVGSGGQAKRCALSCQFTFFDEFSTRSKPSFE
jgi:hypothetical protein